MCGSCRQDGGREAQLGLYREAAAVDFLAGRRLQDECPAYSWRSVLLGWFRYGGWGMLGPYRSAA